ncbi:serine hydrolase domain-containing protein [Mycetocola miduiensis]|uniref:CubicO group peptidase, beta-lactamase class C family n=1 Tax=Mycetocola miduiensis TaxID=995034 RepID=A0A1I4Z5K6_9MICO|nr:serine hydrolase domain-containing protein [Mycetocola miduiensis]SFN45488.1 CubicO group peptidase, beta-lactamase class C family [Mycetocola miduiensis]
MNRQSTLQAVADDLVQTGPAGAVLGLSFQGARTVVASGFATLGNARPMTVDTAFDLASVSKVVGTTAALMRLVSDGALALDSTVASILPRFAGHDGTTVRDLLQHQAGLREWQPLYLSPRIGDGATAVLETIAPLYPLRSGRHYSDLGFQYLGLIIEAVTGRSLGDALHELVFTPLGMLETSFAPRPTVGSPVAASSIGDRAERTMVAAGEPYPVLWSDAGFTWREHELVGEANDGNCFHAFGGVAGHAGLFSTVNDLLTFAEAFSGPGGPSALCTTDVASEFFLPSSEPAQALGFRRMSIDIRGTQHPLLWHPGFTGCVVGFVPSVGLGITLASNRLLTPATPVAAAVLWERLVDVATELHSSTTDTRTP